MTRRSMLKCGPQNLSANPIELLFRMDCRIKSGNDDKRKREAERRQTCFVQPPHLAMRRAPRRVSVRKVCAHNTCAARSPAGVPPAALGLGPLDPRVQLQAMFPGTRQDVWPGTGAPTGGRRPRALQCVIRKKPALGLDPRVDRFSGKIMHHSQALPAPANPSPGKAPPGPVVVPAS